MSRFIKKKKEDIGLSPYALVFRGLKKMDKIFLSVMNFDLDQVREYEIKSDDQLLELKNNKNVSLFLKKEYYIKIYHKIQDFKIKR
jgi:magnesium transporter